MVRLYFTIGSARSGKSTLVSEYAERFDLTIVSGDSIRKALHGCRYSSYAEGMVDSIKHIMIRSLLDSGNIVIVDGTHTTIQSIIKLLEIEPDASPIVMNTDLDICIERAIATNQKDLIPVIERHHLQMNLVKQEFGSYEELVKSLSTKIKNNPEKFGVSCRIAVE